MSETLPRDGDVNMPIRTRITAFDRPMQVLACHACGWWTYNTPTPHPPRHTAASPCPDCKPRGHHRTLTPARLTITGEQQ